ncbi:MAG: penicillin-binding protein activator LpoB [Bacteroidota bacterium]
MKKVSVFFILCSILFSLNGCYSSRKVKRVSPGQQIDLSGRWNDTDSRQTAETMINQVLNEPWLENFKRRNNGERPVVVVGLIRNKSHEHIGTETFIKDIEREFIKSARVRLVQAGDKRDELRKERMDQQKYASVETAKEWGKELGADYIMQGSVNSIVDSYRKEKVVMYQINLELTDLETNEIVWIGDKKIKKYIED